MKKSVDCNLMKWIDSYTINQKGIPSCVLMERAALAVAEEIEKRAGLNEKVLVVCGSGNNGGDGIAIARILKLQGYHVDVFLAGKIEKMTEETRMQYQIALNYHVSFVNNIQWNEYTTIVDAIFGVGLARDIEGTYRELIDHMNHASAYKVAVDIPSGIHGDSGCVLGIAFQADVTVTFAYMKHGLCLYPGKMFAGEVIVADIGIYFDKERVDIQDVHYLEMSDFEMFPARVPYGNKGTFGKVLIVAGSKGMCGAAYMAAAGALAGGAGMVKIATAEENRIPLQTLLPEAMLSCDFSEDENRKNLDWCDVIVIGPGLGTSMEAAACVEWYLKNGAKCDKTVILDADGLNLLSGHTEWKELLPKNLIITPHLGEMSRLTGISIVDIKKDLIGSARKYAKEISAVCVLKDACTVIADGMNEVYLNLSGNAGMATAGSGDVLAGILAAVCCMYLPSFIQKTLNVSNESATIPFVSLCKQAALGVMLHGCSGDKAAERKGMYSMTARDIIDYIPYVLHRKEDE